MDSSHLQASDDELLNEIYEALRSAHNNRQGERFMNEVGELLMPTQWAFLLARFVTEHDFEPFHYTLPESPEQAALPPTTATRVNPQAQPQPKPQTQPQPQPAKTSSAQQQPQSAVATGAGSLVPSAKADWSVVGIALQEIASEYKVKIEFLGYHVAPRVIQLFYALGRGTRLKQVEALEAEFVVRSSLDVPILNPAVTYGPRRVVIQLARADWEAPIFSDFINPSMFDSGYMGHPQVIHGLGNDGNLVVKELSSMLVVGTTGGGKSNYLRAALLAVLFTTPHNLLKISYVALSGFAFNGLEELPWTHQLKNQKERTTTIRTVYEYQLLLDEAEEEIAKRDAVFRLARVEDIAGYNAITASKPLPHWILVVDEVADIADAADPDALKEIRKKESAIARKGRKYGVWLWLATQRLEKRYTIDPNVAANCASHVIFRCADENSAELAECPAALKLCGNGDGYLKHLGRFERMQAFFVPPTYLTQIAEKNRRQYAGMG